MPADNSKPAGPWRPKFTLPTLFTVTSIVCVGAALMGGLVRAGSDSVNKAFYVILVCAAPVGLMLCLFGLQWLRELRDNKADGD